MEAEGEHARSSRRPGADAVRLARDAAAFARYVGALPGLLRAPLGAEEARSTVAESLASRERQFLAVLRRGIEDNPRSPFRALLRHAGIESGDVERLAADHGLEGALERLHEAGVYVTLDEFKGRRPIERPGVALEARPEDFDNPHLGAVYEQRTGGSRGPGRRIMVDLGLVAYETAYDVLAAAAFPESRSRPVGMWRPVPPGVAGMKQALCFAKQRVRVERWFSQNRLTARGGTAREYALTWAAILASRRFGAPIPVPEYVPVGEAPIVARWLAAKARAGRPAFLTTPPSAAVRACLAAREAGLDVAGSWLQVSGEPFTEGKAAVLAERGCRAAVIYAMSEVGRIGIACGAPAALDDVHAACDKLAILQRRRELPGGRSVGALYVTTLHPLAPKLVLNLESGDYATLEQRDCGCPFGAAGLRLHLHTIRSYEKLVSEGISFAGEELLSLLEVALPRRFGGSPGDYQLVEEEVDGLPRVSLLVSPRLGPLDDAEVAGAVLDGLGSGPPSRAMMADVWRTGGTLRVVRREPHATLGAKIQPLHVLGAGGRPGTPA